MSNLLAWNFDEASGAVLDLSGNGRTWTPGAGNGNSLRNAGGHTNSGMTQSIADTAIGPALTGLQTANRTIMAWVNQSTSITGWILEFNVGAISSGCWGILWLNGQVHIQARSSSSLVRASGTPTFGAYYHIAGTYDGSNVRLYLNGTLAATVALAGGLRTDADVFRVMDQSASQTIWDDARLFDTALSQSEIQTQMNTPVSGTTPPKVYFSNGAQASGIYEMTSGGILVQRNNLITIK